MLVKCFTFWVLNKLNLFKYKNRVQKRKKMCTEHNQGN